MVAELVGNHICLGEFAWRSELLTELVEEAEVNVDPFVFGTVERSGGRLGRATTGVRVVAEQHQLGMAVPLQFLLPGLLHVVEHVGDELYFSVPAGNFVPAGIPIRLARVLTRGG